MMNEIVTLYLTDKTGRRFWLTNCNAGYSCGVRHTLQGHLAQITSGHHDYANVGIDRETARLVEESEPAHGDVLNGSIHTHAYFPMTFAYGYGCKMCGRSILSHADRGTWYD